MEIKAFSPLTENYDYKEHKLSFKDVVEMNKVIEEGNEDTLVYRLTVKYLEELDISKQKLSSMASRCKDIEVSALKALLTMDVSAMGEYAEISGDAYRWDLHDGENWNVEESEAGKVAFVLFKIHYEKAKEHIWSDVKVLGKELKKYSDILDDLEDDEEY